MYLVTCPQYCIDQDLEGAVGLIFTTKEQCRAFEQWLVSAEYAFGTTHIPDQAVPVQKEIENLLNLLS
jgi:hypothetical protein